MNDNVIPLMPDWRKMTYLDHFRFAQHLLRVAEERRPDRVPFVIDLMEAMEETSVEIFWATAGRTLVDDVAPRQFSTQAARELERWWLE